MLPLITLIRQIILTTLLDVDTALYMTSRVELLPQPQQQIVIIIITFAIIKQIKYQSSNR